MIRYVFLIMALALWPALTTSAAAPSQAAPVEARALGPEILDGLWKVDIGRTRSLLGAEAAEHMAKDGRTDARLEFNIAEGRCRAWTDASKKKLLLNHPLEVVGMENDTVRLRVEGQRLLEVEVVDNDIVILRGRGVFSRIKTGEK
jgi:hypothetical protein